MGKERDTQFLGFAKALLHDLFCYTDCKDWHDLLEQGEPIIAQRAYDLVAHTINIVPQLAPVKSIQTIEQAISCIPDLTKLPEVINE